MAELAAFNENESAKTVYIDPMRVYLVEPSGENLSMVHIGNAQILVSGNPEKVMGELFGCGLTMIKEAEKAFAGKEKAMLQEGKAASEAGGHLNAILAHQYALAADDCLNWLKAKSWKK